MINQIITQTTTATTIIINNHTCCNTNKHNNYSITSINHSNHNSNNSISNSSSIFRDHNMEITVIQWIKECINLLINMIAREVIMINNNYNNNHTLID